MKICVGNEYFPCYSRNMTSVLISGTRNSRKGRGWILFLWLYSMLLHSVPLQWLALKFAAYVFKISFRYVNAKECRGWIIDAAEVGHGYASVKRSISEVGTATRNSISTMSDMAVSNMFTQSDLGAHFFEQHYGNFQVRLLFHHLIAMQNLFMSTLRHTENRAFNKFYLSVEKSVLYWTGKLWSLHTNGLWLVTYCLFKRITGCFSWVFDTWPSLIGEAILIKIFCSYRRQS